MTPKRTKHGALAAPVEPDWHKQLKPVAAEAGRWKQDSDPFVIQFSNLCRRFKSFGHLTDWSLNKSGSTVTSVKWTARNPKWSGQA